jgi:four helix bundle protein
VALNISEASGSSGGTRRERYRNALGSARETGACIDVALALGYVESVDAGLLDALDKVRATLVRVLQ